MKIDGILHEIQCIIEKYKWGEFVEIEMHIKDGLSPILQTNFDFLFIKIASQKFQLVFIFPYLCHMGKHCFK